MPQFIDNVDVAARLERIQNLANRLAKAHNDFAEQHDLSERIGREIEAAKLTRPAR